MEVNSCIQGYYVFEETNHRGRIELRAKKEEDPYAVAAIRRSAMSPEIRQPLVHYS